MVRKKILITIIATFLASVNTWGKEVTDTLESTKNDRIIVTYDIWQKDGQFKIKFLDARKKLGQTFSKKYKKLDEIAIVFFDRIGVLGDNMEFSGMNADAIMIPGGVNYTPSRDGYFLLNDNPTIELTSSESTELSIPMFLAHYEGKRRYKIFSRCDDLAVKLAINSVNKVTRQDTQTIITQEFEEEFSDIDEANILINKVSDLLSEQDEYPFTDELRQAISSLRDRSYRITDRKVSSTISELLSSCKSKEDELKDKANRKAAAAAREAELQAKLAEERALARQDSIAAVAQQKAEKEKKRNLWLIIGGVILAILGFVGNQTLQHFRNLKNQRSIMEMQENAVRRAENEAKRRARNSVQRQANKVQYDAKRKVRNIINDNIDGKRKGKKDISI